MHHAFLAALHKDLIVHFILQGAAHAGRRLSACRSVEVAYHLTGIGFWLIWQWRVIVLCDKLRHVLTRAASKHDQVYQRIGTQAVGSMDRDTGNLASSIEAGQWRPLWVNYYTRFDIGWNTAHSIVGGRLNRHRLGNRLNTKVVTRKVRDIRQLLLNHLRAQVAYIEEDVIFAIDAIAIFDLLDDTA